MAASPSPSRARHVDASTRNPDAGAHPVTSDPLEIAAAERAVRRSWERFPYYAWRYAERGRNFSASDSGWLVTLVDLPDLAARAQVRWLGGVLAARGMPQWLLESHLEFLHEELTAAPAVPAERAARYAVLRAAAGDLAAMRERHVPADAFERLADEFNAAMPAPWDKRLRRMGGILVAAVADECAGIERAVSSVEEWACDEARFGAEWVAAVHATIAAARDVAR